MKRMSKGGRGGGEGREKRNETVKGVCGREGVNGGVCVFSKGFHTEGR